MPKSKIITGLKQAVRHARERNGETPHKWIYYRNMVCCERCGIIRRAANQNALCKGKVKITLREDA